MTKEIWAHYLAHKESGERSKQAFPVPGGALELSFTMGTVRALYRPTTPPFKEESSWRQAVEALLSAHQLAQDYRDESYVFSTSEGAYLGRLRQEEFLFTPERFEDKDGLLQDLLALYATTSSSG